MSFSQRIDDETPNLILDKMLTQQDQEIIDSLLPIADSFLPGDDSSLLTTPVLGKDTGTNRNKAINPKPWGIDEDF